MTKLIFSHLRYDLMKEVLLFSLSNLGSKTDVTITSRTLSESGDLRTIVFGVFLEHNIFNVMFYKQKISYCHF